MLQQYLVAIWFLQYGEPLPAPVLTQNLGNVPLGSHSLYVLGLGDRSKPLLPGYLELAAETARTILQTQLALHLNVAACALQLCDWSLAQSACNVVLAQEEENVKALFRLASALEGKQEYRDAIKALDRLLKVQPQHREARSRVADLRKHVKSEKAQFNGLFDRAKDDKGEGFYKEAQLMPQRAEERKKKAHAMANPEIYTPDQLEYMGGEKAAGMLGQFTRKYEEEEMGDNYRTQALESLHPIDAQNMQALYDRGVEPAVYREKLKEAMKETERRQNEMRDEILKESKDYWKAKLPYLVAMGVVACAWAFYRSAAEPDFVTAR